MNNRTLYLSAVLVFGAASFAAATHDLSKDEKKLEQTSSDLDKSATAPEGQKAVESRLKSEFKVDAARVQGLRDQKLGYGEISIVLALAERMPGGITDANVQAIMSQRQGPPVVGWGQIAKMHDVSLGKLNGKVKNVDAAARKQEKADRKEQEKGEQKSEKAARPEKSERPERTERHESHNRTENPGHSRH